MWGFHKRRSSGRRRGLVNGLMCHFWDGRGLVRVGAGLVRVGARLAHAGRGAGLPTG